MERFAKIDSAAELMRRIGEYGVLPLGPCAVPGFSLAEMTNEEDWHSGDPEKDPWQWRAAAASTAVDMPTASAPSTPSMRTSAGVSKQGPVSWQ